MKKVWLYFILVSLLIPLANWHIFAQRGIIIDGKKEDWQGIPPVILEEKPDYLRAAYGPTSWYDIKAVYVALDEKYFYMLIESFGKSDGLIYYIIEVDIDNDSKYDYFFRVLFGKVYVSGLRSNVVKELTDSKIILGDNFEVKIPILSVTTSIKGQIRVHTFGLLGGTIHWTNASWVEVDKTEWGKIDDSYGRYVKIINEASTLFYTATNDFNTKNFPKAKEELLKSKDAFEKTRQIYPERNLPEQASQIGEYLSKIEKIMQADALFTDANNLFNAKDYEASKIKLLAARKIFEEMGDIPKVSEFDVMLAKIENLLNIKQEADSAFSDAKTAFDTKDYQRAKELFTQAKDKYTQLEDSEKVKQCEDYIKQSEENMKKTGIEILPVVLSALVLFYYKKWSR